MSRCGNCRAPVYDRVADVAERSARVARFRAGCGFVCNCFSGMIVPFTNRILQVCDRRIQFGLYICADIGETGNIAGFGNRVSIRINNRCALDLVANRNLRRAAVFCPLRVCINTGRTIPTPCIYGERSQNNRTGCSCILARNGNLSRA